MPKERAALTEKQERLIIQATLMGLTPSDMTKISNRLIALEKERSYIKEVQDASEGMSWSKSDKGWKIIDSQGKVYDCVRFKKSKYSHWCRAYGYDIVVSKPGTRYKTNTNKDVKFYVNNNVPNRLCPENNKELFALLSLIKKGRIE